MGELSAGTALAVWMGASLLVLFESPRLTAAALGLLGLGTGGAIALAGMPFEGAVAFVASAACGLLAFVSRHRAFSVGPTTPRIILVILGGAFSGWAALFVLQSPAHVALRAAIVTPVCILGAALLGGIRRGNFAFVAAALVLALGVSALGFASGRTVLAEASVAAVVLASATRWQRAVSDSA